MSVVIQTSGSCPHSGLYSKCYFNGGSHRKFLPLIIARWTETPVLHCFNGTFVEPVARSVDYVYVVYAASDRNCHIQLHDAFDSQLAGFRWIGGRPTS